MSDLMDTYKWLLFNEYLGEGYYEAITNKMMALTEDLKEIKYAKDSEAASKLLENLLIPYYSFDEAAGTYISIAFAIMKTTEPEQIIGYKVQ